MLAPIAATLAQPQNPVPEPAVYALGMLLARLREEAFYNPQLDRAQFAAAAEPALRQAAPALVALLAHPREEVRQDAVRALAGMGLPAAPFLLRTLGGDNELPRTAAAEALVRMESCLPRQTPSSAGVQLIQQRMLTALPELLKHPAPQVRASACRVLAEFAFGTQASLLEPLVREALKDPDVAVRRYAAKALEQLRQKR